MYEYQYINHGASFSTEQAARAFVAAISGSYKTKDVECHYKPNKYGIFSVWFMIGADTAANKAAELAALVSACENMYK